MCKILEGKMRFTEIEVSQWQEVKNIYMEAFPKPPCLHTWHHHK